MTVKIAHRLCVGVALLAGSFGLSSCATGPTYGTDKNSGQQLVDDLSNIVSIGSKNNNAQIDNKPRPDLVPPSQAARTQLPAPQESVAQAGAADWPESPEQRRQRLRAEATANQNNPNYVSPIIADEPRQSGQRLYLPDGLDRSAERQANMPSAEVSRQQAEEYRRLRQQSSGGTATQRKYLSEPPLDYRQPAATAPVGDPGESEAAKERQRKREATGGKSSWWPF